MTSKSEKDSSAADRITGKAKQLVGEIVGDQALHDEGKRQGARGDESPADHSGPNPFEKLDDLT
jgi:uncharacterized protein YjbJ (UPF0337 family)